METPPAHPSGPRLRHGRRHALRRHAVRGEGVFTSLRSHSRFTALLGKMNLQ